MNSKLDSLKSQWQSLNVSVGNEKHRLESTPVSGNRRLVSAPGKIMAIYRRLLVMSIVWIPLSFCFTRILPLWTCACMAAYFAVMSLLNDWVYRQAKAIDFSTMSVIEALRAVYRLQRSRMIGKAIGAALCLPMVITMIYLFAGHSQEMAIGGITGAVLGVVFGLMLDARIRAEIRAMRSILEEALEPIR